MKKEESNVSKYHYQYKILKIVSWYRKFTQSNYLSTTNTLKQLLRI